MFFSPISERSLKVRLLYLAIYGLLTLGALTMVAPFLIMITGSVEPGTRFQSATALFPSYVVDDGALWDRYIEAKYRNDNDLLRMAWGDGDADFHRLPRPEIDEAANRRWNEFLSESEVPEMTLGLGFSGGGARLPYYYNREFRNWLLERYHTVDGVNERLGTTFRSIQAIQPPSIFLSGASLRVTPLVGHFMDFCRDEVPEARKFAWDAASYYRNVFLPRTVGKIADFNEKYGTQYKSYREVPFSGTMPGVATAPWFTFATKFIRQDFVSLTPAGKAKLEASGRNQPEFIRLMAAPEDVCIVTLDRQYAKWAESRYGVKDAAIPQFSLDSAAFQKEKTFWKRTFLIQNYQYVLDAIFLQGRAMWNTLILVALKVGGALLINPLAAYALSRFKLRKTYHILLFFLVTIAFPSEVTMIPAFLQLKEFNMLNTFWALVLPGLANGFSIFLLKGFFDSLPRELYEAADIDGASEWKMFWIITMSLSKPILAVIALGAFVAAYGTFFYALILCPDPKMWTVMVYVYQLQSSAGSQVVYASLILTAIPTLLVFVLCQNIILRGIVVPTEK